MGRNANVLVNASRVCRGQRMTKTRGKGWAARQRKELWLAEETMSNVVRWNVVRGREHRQRKRVRRFSAGMLPEAARRDREDVD